MLYMRCLPRSRGVPTSSHNLVMMSVTNRGFPQYYSPFNQIKAVTHIVCYCHELSRVVMSCVVMCRHM